MDASLKIVIVDENPIRAAILQDGLREAGYTKSFADTFTYELATLITVNARKPRKP